MPITLTCAQCGKRVNVRDEYVGRALKCPGCKSLLPTAAARGGHPTPSRTPARAPTARSASTGDSGHPFLRKMGIGVTLLGLLGTVGPFFGIGLRKARNQTPEGQMAVGVGLLVMGVIFLGLSFLPPLSTRARKFLMYGIGGVVACFLLLVLLAVLLAPGRRERQAQRDAAAFVSQPGVPISPGPAAMPPRASDPSPAGAAARTRSDASASPIDRLGHPEVPAALQTKVEVVTETPRWAREPQSTMDASMNRHTRVTLRNASPGDLDEIVRIARNSSWFSAAVKAPDANGEATIWAVIPPDFVRNVRGLGTLLSEDGNALVFDWSKLPPRRDSPSPSAKPAGTAVATPRGVTSTADQAPPGPSWASAADATTVLLRGTNRNDTQAIVAAIEQNGFLGWHLSRAGDADGRRWLWIRATPDEVEKQQTFGTLVTREGQTLTIDWKPAATP